MNSLLSVLEEMSVCEMATVEVMVSSTKGLMEVRSQVTVVTTRLSKTGTITSDAKTRRLFSVLSSWCLKKTTIIMAAEPRRKVVVVGAGPVGCLSAMALAKMGWAVEIYESRPGLCHSINTYHYFLQIDASNHYVLDMRLPSSKTTSQQRSINLAISSRGIAALQAIDPAAAERFLETVIPMRGRMIHDLHGNLHSQLYDKDGQVRFDFTHPEIKIPGQYQALY